MIKVTQKELKVIMDDPGFTIEIDNTTYKIGVHKLVYRWSPVYKYWIRSAVSQDLLRIYLREKINRARKLNHE